VDGFWIKNDADDDAEAVVDNGELGVEQSLQRRMPIGYRVIALTMNRLLDCIG